MTLFCLWLLINQSWIFINNNFFYIHDKDIREYFFAQREYFEKLIIERQKYCGKYFEKRDWRDGGYYYKDNFGEHSPQAKEFLNRHPFITEIRSDMTVNVDYRTKGPQEFTYEQSANDCKKYPYMTFHINKFYYKTSVYLLFHRNYRVNKIIMYLTHPDNMKVHDWKFLEKDPELFDKYFNEFSSSEKRDFEKSGNDYPWNFFSRPSPISSEHRVLNCEYSYTSFTPGFTKLTGNWYIYAVVHDYYHENECVN